MSKKFGLGKGLNALIPEEVSNNINSKKEKNKDGVALIDINLIKNTMAFLTLVVLFVLIFISNAYLDIIQLFLFPFVLVNDLLFAAMPISILLLVLFLGLTFISKNPKKYNLL